MLDTTLPGFEQITELAQIAHGDWEKRCIAELLFYRGERQESWRIINTIEDKEYRHNAIESGYNAWEELIDYDAL